MNTRPKLFRLLSGALVLGVVQFAWLVPGFSQDPPVVETTPGTPDLDEAIKLKAVSEGIRDLNKVIDLLQSALDKGLDADDSDFAESMLSDALMGRASSLMRVINTRSILDQRVQQIRQLVASDLRRVIDFDEPPAAAYLMLAQLSALPGGDPYESRRMLDKYLEDEKLAPEERAEALVLRGRLQRDPIKAIADFDQAIELDPENESYRLARAVLLRGQKKLDEALASIDELLADDPEDASALMLQGEVFRELERYDDALESFGKAAAVAPESPGPYQGRGEIYREQGKLEEAIVEYNKVLELQPSALQTLVLRAEANLAAENYDAAIADAQVVLQGGEDVPANVALGAHRIYAESLAFLKRLPEAIEHMERVCQLVPDQPEVKMQLGNYYLQAERPRLAIEKYTEVIEQNPNSMLALRFRGDAYLNIGEHEKAIADFEAALKLEPEDTGLLNNLAWVLATSPDAKLRSGQRAIELATKACELTEYKLPHILSTLAAAFAESGNFETAIKWSQQAVDLGDVEHDTQLAEELEKYRDGEPWRERQTMKEKDDAIPPLTDTPQMPPHPEIQRSLPLPKLEHYNESNGIQLDLPESEDGDSE